MQPASGGLAKIQQVLKGNEQEIPKHSYLPSCDPEEGKKWSTRE